MKFCAIGPLAAREIFQEHSHHMVLAQYLYDEEYFNFYNRLKQHGRFLVLDSGVYEGSAVDDRQLQYWCERLNPDAVILPDKPHDAGETLKRSLAFAQRLDDSQLSQIAKWKVLHAPAGVLDVFTQSYIYDSRLFDGVCFSRLTQNYGYAIDNHTPFVRPAFIKYLQCEKIWNHRCYHHALGMIDGSTDELEALKRLKVDSIDSSAPIWRGLHLGYALPNSPTPFAIPFNPFATTFKHLDFATRQFKQLVHTCES